MKSLVSLRSIVLTFIFPAILSSCREEVIPERTVYGEAQSSIVLNLFLVDPLISEKTVTASGNQYGKIRIEDGGNILIYESDANFREDQITVYANNKPKVVVHFIELSNDNSCKSYAKSYDLKIKKNAPVISVEFDETNFCDSPVRRDPLLFETILKPIPGLTVFVNGKTTGFTFEAPPDYTGTGETVYDLGYYPKDVSFNVRDIRYTQLVTTGLIKITVEE